MLNRRTAEKLILRVALPLLAAMVLAEGSGVAKTSHKAVRHKTVRHRPSRRLIHHRIGRRIYIVPLDSPTYGLVALDYDANECPHDGADPTQLADWEIVGLDGTGQHHVAGPGDPGFDIYSPCSPDIDTGPGTTCDIDYDVDISAGNFDNPGGYAHFLYKELGYPCRVGEFDIVNTRSHVKSKSRRLRLSDSDPDDDPLSYDLVYPGQTATLTLTHHHKPDPAHGRWEIFAMTPRGNGSFQRRRIASAKDPCRWGVTPADFSSGHLELAITPPDVAVSDPCHARLGLYRISYHGNNANHSQFFHVAMHAVPKSHPPVPPHGRAKS